MNRDFVFIVGAQGYGKSLWAKLFTRLTNRFINYDPLMSYPNVLYRNMTEEIFDATIKNSGGFRLGSGFIDDVDIISNLAFACGNCTLLIEECGTVFRRGTAIEPWAKRNIFMGRHRKVNIVLVAQRATSIPIDIRSQANRIISFMQHEADDIHALTSTIGRRYHFKISQLQKYNCIDWKEGNVTEYSIENEVKKYFPQRSQNESIRNEVSDLQGMA